MKSDARNKKKADYEREVIVRSLPSFISQMILLLNSGMVFDDVFCKIADGYEKNSYGEENCFIKSICHISRTHLETGEKITSLFLAYSRKSGVRQLNQAATIIAENYDKGTFLWERLSQLGDELWEERKRKAIEKIRLAESKMSFPLALLLMALLVVTGAPALMQM